MFFPHRAREEQQATMRVFRERHTAFTLLQQGVTVLGRYGHPPLRIEIDR
jgi:hypothetical protein